MPVKQSEWFLHLIHLVTSLFISATSPMPDMGVYQKGLVEKGELSVFALFPVTRHNKELVEAQPWTSRSIPYPAAFTAHMHTQVEGGPAPELTNRFWIYLPDLDFHLSIIKLCTIKPLARPMKALAQDVGQWDLSAPEGITGKYLLRPLIK